MKLNMDSIQFESRSEIGAVIKALEEWQRNHKPNEDLEENIKELIDKLDIMSMNW